MIIYLILLSAVIYTVTSSHLDNGAYSYEYHTNHGSRNEVRHPNGQITGGYNYLKGSKLHEVKYASVPNKQIKIVSHNSYEIIPNDVYSKITYKPVANEGVQFDELPPVYVRHVPSPVKHEPIVPIIDVASPLRGSYQHPAKIKNPAPERRSFQIRTEPEVTYHVAPIPTFVNTPEYLLPEYILSQSDQHQDISHQKTTSIPDVTHRKEVHLGADVPLTRDGLIYEVALARDQHLAAIAAIKAELPELH